MVQRPPDISLWLFDAPIAVRNGPTINVLYDLQQIQRFSVSNQLHKYKTKILTNDIKFNPISLIGYLFLPYSENDIRGGFFTHLVWIIFERKPCAHNDQIEEENESKIFSVFNQKYSQPHKL